LRGGHEQHDGLRTDGPVIPRRTLFRYWQGSLRGSEFTWAVAFVVPYIVVFLAFVVYPVFYGAWMGSNLQLYRDLFADPIYPKYRGQYTAVSGVWREPQAVSRTNVVGIFMHPGWPTKLLLMVFVLPWAVPALPTFIRFTGC